MILEMEVSDSITIPYAQYAINDKQLINAIPLPAEVVALTEVEGFNVWHWGDFNSLMFIMKAQLNNSLMEDNWDFNTYPNPEIVILTRKN